MRQRRFFDWLAPALLALCLAAWAESALAAENHLADGGFEAASAAWELMGDDGGTGAPDATVRHTGTAAGRLHREAVGFSAFDQVVDGLPPGDTYLLRGFVRASDAAAVVSFGVRTPGTGDAYPRLYRALAAPGAWEPIEFMFTAPAEKHVRIIIGGRFKGDLWFDDVTLTAVDTWADALAAEWNQRIRTADGPVYTGLVVDATGLGVERGMSPRIYDPAGHLLYGGSGADPDAIVKLGIVAYAGTTAEAAANARLQLSPLYPYSRPLIIRPLRAYPERPVTSVVVSANQAREIRASLARYDYFGRFAVVFVVDSFVFPIGLTAPPPA
ncbi:MAG TPA: hypothetical protein VFK80_08555 [Limnochordia bacterium]|nr:hypothetical protein [Limnochordia bacterium]